MLRQYYILTKPGIIRGNIITAAAGFMLAANGTVNIGLLAATLLGLAFIIAAACVSNNYMDRGIDQKMARTRSRALAHGDIPSLHALVFAGVLAALGTAILLLFTNLLTTVLALLGYVAYVFIYGIAKRRTVHGTVIGSVSGAIPPLVGYAAVANDLTLGAWILFAIVVCWQMPHFYAIAMYGIKDYKAAGIPILPLVNGMKAAKLQTMAYIVAFTIAVASLTIAGYASYTFMAAGTMLGLAWLWIGLKDYKTADDTVWARKMFKFSLLVIALLSALIVIDSFWYMR